MSIKGQVVVITGGTGSLGSVVTARFARAGARVAVTYRNPAEWEALQAVLAEPDQVLGLQCDVGVEAQVEAAFAQVQEKLGEPQVLLNLAGG